MRVSVSRLCEKIERVAERKMAKLDAGLPPLPSLLLRAGEIRRHQDRPGPREQGHPSINVLSRRGSDSNGSRLAHVPPQKRIRTTDASRRECGSTCSQASTFRTFPLPDHPWGSKEKERVEGDDGRPLGGRSARSGGGDLCSLSLPSDGAST
ncbi:hypothetical protein IE53DRAFT_130523 [Violaceomyces palustris]|uniref:Uncharacterized protein n=1 Tax=Violaceomyces palustris TaxID=1673888 RepID=A0ACD0NVE2_9BASI|nr:hypothetical protein IE53DRAFT_130523 [Violaceomyces palustris]